MSYSIYILECQNKSYYTGITTDLKRRFSEHQQGINCRYTRAFPPKSIVAAWDLPDGNKSIAQKIEYFIKRRKKQEKRNLIKEPKKLLKNLKEHCIIPYDTLIVILEPEELK